jgi:hypothetical protein
MPAFRFRALKATNPWRNALMIRLRPRIPRSLVTSLIACTFVVVACSSGDERGDERAADESAPDNGVNSSEQIRYVVFGDFVNDVDSLPRLRFRDDGQVSLNDRCAVREVKLNPKMQPAYVNGRPVGFC